MSDRETVIVVSGLPRSGTSMMMKMLEAGGMEVLTDQMRMADESNPGGYYELESVKKTKQNYAWLDRAGGKAVKIVSKLLYELPSDRNYRVLFMKRRMEEVLSSQRVMLKASGKETEEEITDEEMGRLFEIHLKKVLEWLAGQKNFDVLTVNYNDLVSDPIVILEIIGQFLERNLDTPGMARVMDTSLYRQRK